MPAAPEKPYRPPRNKPTVCYVTDRKSLSDAESFPKLLATIRTAISADTDWVQIREKDLPAKDLLALARASVSLAAGHASTQKGYSKAQVLVNDRVDIAILAGAAGVHLGGKSMPVREIVEWCRAGNAPKDFMVGISCHNLTEAREAQTAGASYISFGPIFETPSKQSYGQPQGIVKLNEVCHAVGIPVIAIGGVNEGNGAECVYAGAAGIAAIRFFQETGKPETLNEQVKRFHQLR